MVAGGRVEQVSAAGGWNITLFNAEPRGTYDRIMHSPFYRVKRPMERSTHKTTLSMKRGA